MKNKEKILNLKNERLFSTLSIYLRGAGMRLDPSHKFLISACFQLSERLKEMEGKYKIVKK